MFDEITPEDMILAFFPCTRFEDQCQLWLSGNSFSQKGWSDKEKLKYSLKLHEELCLNYKIFTKLFSVCVERGIPLVVENPDGLHSYLKEYFPIKATFSDKDRTLRGDRYKKPTQYWFMNCVPKHNFIFEPLEFVEIQSLDRVNATDERTRQTMRSIIHPQYANRFIREFILEEGL